MNTDTFDTVTPLTLISTTAPAVLVERGEKPEEEDGETFFSQKIKPEEVNIYS